MARLRTPVDGDDMLVALPMYRGVDQEGNNNNDNELLTSLFRCGTYTSDRLSSGTGSYPEPTCELFGAGTKKHIGTRHVNRRAVTFVWHPKILLLGVSRQNDTVLNPRKTQILQRIHNRTPNFPVISRQPLPPSDTNYH